MDLSVVANLFRKAYDDTDGFGGSHIIVADGNVDDGSLDYCEAQTYKLLLPSEVELIAALRQIPERDRLIAYYLDDSRSYHPMSAQEAMAFAIAMTDQHIEDVD